eukprot:CAMPEP_0172483778 /NCGR_PEP_ID=MMETSP1066-20121228/10923_1 /TAXON_ID=671091 /ORGANISM="Coscinodiscus wailesii, Strain CCMP2513" /LENGTH=84 /DNA_ID=CAMNT_0013247867 /DNA_START=13 /DNA_END=264 /DNA_ORIENTATION=-
MATDQHDADNHATNNNKDNHDVMNTMKTTFDEMEAQFLQYVPSSHPARPVLTRPRKLKPSFSFAAPTLHAGARNTLYQEDLPTE